MTNPSSEVSRPAIRRLRPADQHQITAHFLSLDPETRRMRFGISVGDSFLTDYAANVLDQDSLVLGAYLGNRLLGVAELSRDALRPDCAEAAFSVQVEWQDHGFGDALVSHIVSAARNRRIRTLRMICLRENNRMQHLALKHNAIFELGSGDIEATLNPARPTLYSLTQELIREAKGLIHFLQCHPQYRAFWRRNKWSTQS